MTKKIDPCKKTACEIQSCLKSKLYYINLHFVFLMSFLEYPQYSSQLPRIILPIFDTSHGSVLHKVGLSSNCFMFRVFDQAKTKPKRRYSC